MQGSPVYALEGFVFALPEEAEADEKPSNPAHAVSMVGSILPGERKKLSNIHYVASFHRGQVRKLTRLGRNEMEPFTSRNPGQGWTVSEKLSACAHPSLMLLEGRQHVCVVVVCGCGGGGGAARARAL